MKNILLIIADQLDKSVLSCYGGHEVKTPAIDSIAEDGMRFDEAYTPSAVCTPSRGCLLTGLAPFKHGAFRNGLAVGKDIKGFADYLNDEYGYSSEYIGKWHLGSGGTISYDFSDDNHLGFTFPFGAIETAHAKSVLPDGTFTSEIRKDGRYMSDWIADRTIERLALQDKEKPFFMVSSFPDPHQPFLVREPYGRMFNPTDMDVPSTFNEKELPDWAEMDEWGRKHYFHLNAFSRNESFRMMKAQYLGEVACLDENVGRILEALKKNGQEEDTAVLFVSDHGEYLGRHGLMEKNNLYVDVYSIPLLMKSPGLIKTGSVSSRMMDIRDIPSSVMHAAGIADDYPFADGVDALIEKNERCYIAIYPSDVPRAGRIRKKDEIAFVGRSWDGRIEFRDHIYFNREKDPDEVHNLYPLLDEGKRREYGSAVLSDMRSAGVPDYMIPSILLEMEDNG